jgi:hypothetical protein
MQHSLTRAQTHSWNAAFQDTMTNPPTPIANRLLHNHGMGMQHRDSDQICHNPLNSASLCDTTTQNNDSMWLQQVGYYQRLAFHSQTETEAEPTGVGTTSQTF